MCHTYPWRRIQFCSLFAILYLLTLVDTVEVGQLTFCGSQSTGSRSRSLIFVSTLDGKISALDANNNGQKQWTLDFNEGPMLSSNIHRRELGNNGQWVRLIPSLSGGLYKFDGEHLEAVPISTEQLLHSSFRYSDDLVFSGGKETLSYGVSTTTGKILYECNISGCTNNTDGEGILEKDLLVVQRFQQTIRAVEPRTGIERWNFSVGQHDLVLVQHTDICGEKTTAHMSDIEIKVIVPEGLIWAINKSNPSVKLWQHKFDVPIVTIWHEDANAITNGHGGLKEINLFDSSQWSWGSEFSISPSLYLGMHDRQLYVQENTEIYKSLELSPKYHKQSRFPWQPYPAIGSAITNAPIKTIQSDDTDISIQSIEGQTTTALSVLYNSEYINGHGYYLYSKEQLYLDSNKQCNGTHPDLIMVEGIQKPTINYVDENETPVQVIIVSFWYWWKEVLIISITTAILLNFMLTQRLLNATTTAKDAVLPPLIVERHIESPKSDKHITDDTNNTNNFKSRYLTDFEPIDCLGKGGYGVVFEAKNKIDDCNYAIKRIALPNSQDSRERVMREVKALAKLDHHNIVRYFNAWLECPPAGWQEEHDQQWINKQEYPASEFPSELTHTETKLDHSVCIDISQPSVDSACDAYELECNKNGDSFIVFDKTNGYSEGAIHMDNCSTESSDLSLSNQELKETVSQTNNTEYSEDIVFQKSVGQCTGAKERSKRKSLFSLEFNNKSGNRKSAKMFLYIQMQLCQRLSLREWLKQSTVRDNHRILNIFQQIVNAVEYVHLQGLIHRDLKPSNIFFAFDHKIKIGDFGLVTAMTEGCNQAHTPADENKSINMENSLHTACVGTHLYMSPEQMNGQVYNYKVDIYSLGIILFELLIPFVTEMERMVTLSNLRKSIFPKDFNINYPDEYQLLLMMLDERPEKRPTTLGIKARPPLSNYETINEYNTSENSKWHFELPQLSRHSSVISNSSSTESWENIS